MKVLGQKAIPHPVEQLVQQIELNQLADHSLAAGEKKMRLSERKKESFYSHIENVLCPCQCAWILFE